MPSRQHGRTEKIAYLEGIRGIAAFVVFLLHFGSAFYPAFMFNDPARAHIRNRLDARMAGTPLDLLFAGELSVCVFFVLSGYVLSIGFFTSPNREVVAVSFVRRYFRLEIPILASVLAGWALIASGACYNVAVIPWTKSGWLGLFLRVAPDFTSALREATVNVIVTRRWDYNPVLWTMRIELLGSYLVYSLLLVFALGRWRFVAYGVALAYLIDSYYALFLFGLLLSAAHPWTSAWSQSRFGRAFSWTSLVGGLFLGSHPVYFEPKGWWQLLDSASPLLPQYFPRVAAALIVTAVVLNPTFQSMLSTQIPRFLGRISFSLYLIHFLIIASWSCGLFGLLRPYVPYNVCTLIVFVSTLVIVLRASIVMTRYVDEPGIRFSRLVGARALDAARRIARPIAAATRSRELLAFVERSP